jgi:hypothetical protein
MNFGFTTLFGAYYLVVPQNDPAAMKSAPCKLQVEVMGIDHMEKSLTEN